KLAAAGPGDAGMVTSAGASEVPFPVLAGEHGEPVFTAQDSRSRPGILLDRDGTIIVDHGHVGSIDRVDFLEGAPEAIARFNRAGLPVAVLTNQAGVAKGLY